MVLSHRSRRHQKVRLLRLNVLGRLLAIDRRAAGPEAFRPLILLWVRTRDLDATGEQDLRNRAHPDARDPDEVDLLQRRRFSVH